MGEPGNDFLDRLSGISLSRLYLTQLLDEVVASTASLTGADAAALMLLDESGDTLLFKAAVGLSRAAADTVRLPRDRGVCWTVVRERRPVATSRASERSDFFSVPEAGEERFSSMLGAPIIDGDDLVGVLYVQTVEPREFSDEEIDRLAAIARRVAGPVKAAWFFERARERARVLSELNTLSRLLSATDSVDEILDQTMRYAASLTHSRRQIVWLMDEKGSLGERHYPESVGDPDWLRPIREGIVAHVARERTPLAIVEIGLDDRFPELERVARRSLLLQPMICSGELMGVLLIADRVGGEYVYPFSGEEGGVLAAVAQSAAQAVARARTHMRLALALEENRRNVRELSILFQLSMAMQRTIDLDSLLRVILSCVTVGSGLGFNRAILFLVNEAVGSARGMIGMGPASAEEAGRIWGELAGKADDLGDFVGWLLGRDEANQIDSLFNRIAMSLHSPLSGDGVLARCLRERQPINIDGGHAFGEEDAYLYAALGSDRFAVVPLVASDTALGAILVDNNINRRPITDVDLELLTRFAAPAAWAIANVKLLDRLSSVNAQLLSMERQMAQVERISALGEIYAELAHELKNPLVTIGGFARRLTTMAGDPEQTANYSRIIVEEVERLERLLRNTLDASKSSNQTSKTMTDLNGVAEEAVDVYWRMMTERGVECRLSLAPSLPSVMIDEAQIRQVVINLLLNAVEAMGCPHHKGMAKVLSVKTLYAPGDEPTARLMISDTGGGVAPGDLAKVFDPFFTTKSAGTGLGLSLCKKMVRMHHGRLEIDNRLGVGVTFTIILPCHPAGRPPSA